MTNKIESGQILEGKVTGIQPYGAFVAVSENVQGLVHISEVTHGYVKDINDHLKVGDEIKVKVLNVDEESNKVSLSIRATQKAPQKKPQAPRKQNSQTETTGFNTLKGKHEEWIEQSKEREETFKN